MGGRLLSNFLRPYDCNGGVQMKIIDALVTPCLGGYYFEDVKALKKGVKQDGYFLIGEPVTPGHQQVRIPGEAISIILVLEDGRTAFGDCTAVQYSGVFGRDPVLLSEEYIPLIEEVVLPFLIGREMTSFKNLANEIDTLRDTNGNLLHTGIRYGVSQAVLDAVSQATAKLPAEVILEEFETGINPCPDVLAQSGDDRYLMVDKMIMKRIPSIPHGLFNDISKLGPDGSALVQYVDWLRKRIEKYGSADYRPTFHIDVYGTIGSLFNNDLKKVLDYIETLVNHASPFRLRIEHPVNCTDRESLLLLMSELTAKIDRKGIPVEICADDWCNTLEDVEAFVDAKAAHMIQIKMPDLGSIYNSIRAVEYCKRNNVKAFLGGTCNETDQSSRLSVQTAIACGADLIYNKPGMSVDEGYMIVFNEIQRTTALLERRRPEIFP